MENLSRRQIVQIIGVLKRENRGKEITKKLRQEHFPQWMNLSFQTERPLRAGNNIWGRNEGTQERYRSVPKKQFFKKEGWEWGGRVETERVDQIQMVYREAGIRRACPLNSIARRFSERKRRQPRIFQPVLQEKCPRWLLRYGLCSKHSDAS